MSLEWHEELSVGNDMVDSGRKHLFEIINQVQYCLRTNERGKLTPLVESLSQFLKVHFSREEKIAIAVGYEQLSQLYESHLTLTMQLNQIKQKSGAVWTDLSTRQIEYFFVDLLAHIIKDDLLMKPALAKYSPSFVPG